jgi:hypothetical protein
VHFKVRIYVVHENATGMLHNSVGLILNWDLVFHSVFDGTLIISVELSYFLEYAYVKITLKHNRLSGHQYSGLYQIIYYYKIKSVQ